jgi:hypothetical protein
MSFYRRDMAKITIAQRDVASLLHAKNSEAVNHLVSAGFLEHPRAYTRRGDVFYSFDAVLRAMPRVRRREESKAKR